ncbi:MAG TPA: SMP-30/gluconolactonase/LRE family protein [Candidatus Acidoferrales bacterium]|nr:SMP-30/gluconolactonase/LRE family protein [Candidatus Acidoferrales bacterium]
MSLPKWIARNRSVAYLLKAVLKTTRVLLDGLIFPEGPRWHDGALYFSDMHAGIVWRVTPEGVANKVWEFPGTVSGLGWLANGTMLVVSMADRQLLRMTPKGPETAADLSSFVSNPINDMVVDRKGRAYIGNFGFDLIADQAPRPTVLLCVEPDGSARAVADDLHFPNGMVITPDGKTLIVGETFAARLSAFDIQSDGSLTNRRVYAAVEGIRPDGICLDAEGAVWVAWAGGNKIVRVKEGGKIAETIPLPERHAYACMLGGADSRDLYICTARSFVPKIARELRAGKIEVARVEVPGAGLP